MLFNSTIKEEIKKKIFQITKREKQEQSTTQLKDSFDTFSLSFFPKNRKGRARKKKIHKSDTETVFPPSNVGFTSGESAREFVENAHVSALVRSLFRYHDPPLQQFRTRQCKRESSFASYLNRLHGFCRRLRSPSSSLSLFLSLSLFALTSQKRNRWPNSLQIHPSLPSVSNYLSAHPVQSV